MVCSSPARTGTCVFFLHFSDLASFVLYLASGSLFVVLVVVVALFINFLCGFNCFVFVPSMLAFHGISSMNLLFFLVFSVSQSVTTEFASV